MEPAGPAPGGLSPRPASAEQLLGGQTRDPTHKSSHLNVVRSMSLLHELQTYLVGIENLAAQRHVDLQRLAEEKAALERTSKSMTVALYRQSHSAGHPPSLASSTVDLPPKDRAAIGDAKVLRERVRRQRAEAAAAEATIKRQQEQITALNDRLQGREARGAAGANDSSPGGEGGTPSPKDAAVAAKAAQDALASQALRLKDLERQVAVGVRSRESDARKARGEAAEAKKAAGELRAEIAQLRGLLDAKDKELRAEALRVKELKHQLAPSRPRSTAGERRGSARGGGVSQDPVIMMCIVVEETGPSAEAVEAAVRRKIAAEATAAVDPRDEALAAAAAILDDLITMAADVAQDTELRALREELAELRDDNDGLRSRAESAETKVAEYEASENNADGGGTESAALEAAAAAAAAAESTKKGPGAGRGRGGPPRAAGGYGAPKAASPAVPGAAGAKKVVPPRASK